MAKQIEGVYEEVLSCAKKEFLEKGFKDASLRTIAQEAGTSTGSIYTRFQNKEGLFRAVVDPVVSELHSWFTDVQETFHQKEGAYQKEHVYSYSKENYLQFVDYLYDHLEMFKILLVGAEGTEYAGFVDHMVDVEVDYTVKFLEATGNDQLKKGELSIDFLHILSSAFYSGVFEVVLHNMDKETGRRYVKKLGEFYTAGFERILA